MGEEQRAQPIDPPEERARRRAALALSLTTIALLSACAPSPQETLRGYAQAVAAGDPEAAYAHMAPAYREATSYETFERQFRRRHGEGSETMARTLEGVADQPAFIESFVALTEFDTVKLALHEDGWYIEEGLFNFYGQRSPREALRSFLRALGAGRYEVVLRFLPAAAQAFYEDPEALQAELEAQPELMAELIARLSQALEATRDEIPTRGNRAHLRYGEDKKVDFLREDGMWKIEDLD